MSSRLGIVVSSGRNFTLFRDHAGYKPKLPGPLHIWQDTTLITMMNKGAFSALILDNLFL